MTEINIFNLHSTGYDLFQDSESFLTELIANEEMEAVKGGRMIGLPPTTRTICLTLACEPTTLFTTKNAV